MFSALYYFHRKRVHHLKNRSESVSRGLKCVKNSFTVESFTYMLGPFLAASHVLHHFCMGKWSKSSCGFVAASQEKVAPISVVKLCND